MQTVAINVSNALHRIYHVLKCAFFSMLRVSFVITPVIDEFHNDI